MEIGILVQAALFALIGYFIGKPKGQETAGLWLGLLLSLLGVIITALLKSKGAARRPGRDQTVLYVSIATVLIGGSLLVAYFAMQPRAPSDFSRHDERCAREQVCAELGHCVWRRSFSPDLPWQVEKCGPSADGCAASNACKQHGKCTARPGSATCE